MIYKSREVKNEGKKKQLFVCGKILERRKMKTKEKKKKMNIKFQITNTN